jgi:hypothetical protein
MRFFASLPRSAIGTGSQKLSMAMRHLINEPKKAGSSRRRDHQPLGVADTPVVASIPDYFWHSRQLPLGTTAPP